MGFPKGMTPEEHWAKVAGYEIKKPEKIEKVEETEGSEEE